MHAVEHLGRVPRMGVDAVDDLLMTAHTVLLKHGGIAGLHHDRLVKILQGEALRMMVAVFRLRHVLPDEIVRGMTIVARRYGMMRTLLPACILLTHDVAVHARLGVVGEIGEPLAVIEGVPAHASEESDR